MVLCAFCDLLIYHLVLLELHVILESNMFTDVVLCTGAHGPCGLLSVIFDSEIT